MEVIEAIERCNFKKAIGTDGFDGRILEKNDELRRRIAGELAEMLNTQRFPEYLREGRLIALAKGGSN